MECVTDHSTAECPRVRVPRELLERAAGILDDHGYRTAHELRALLTAQPQASRCSDCGYLTSHREHLGCLRKAVAELDAATGGLPQASAAQSAPAGEREAATEAAYAAVVDGGWSSDKEMGVQMFQAGAAWQRTQAEWIQVSERLPSVAQEVIVNSEFDGVTAGFLDSYGEWYSPNSDYKLTRVVAWQPLPAAPSLAASTGQEVEK